MRLSLIFELLLIFVLLAFAASRVIDSKGLHNVRAAALQRKHGKLTHKNRQEDNVNRYCSCSTKLCNCCREFNIPVVALQGPGCASLQYLNGDRLSISMSFGDRVLTNTTISSRRPKPVCMPLPGGVSKFCGRVYNIGRKGEDFNACLGLELRALQDVEASLRVSCFRFGPQGLKVEPPQPLPVVEEDSDDEDDEEDDDDDDDDEDDDDDDLDFDDDEDDDDEDDDNDVDSVDYESFSLLDDDFIDGLFVSESEPNTTKRKPVKKLPVSTTKTPLKKATRKPVRKTPVLRKKVTTKKPTTPAPLKSTTELKITQAPIFVVESTTGFEKKPEIENIVQNTISNDISESVPSPHDSIAAVTSMLQSAPGDEDVKPAQSVSVPAPVNVSSGTLDATIAPILDQAVADSVTEIVSEPITISSQEVSLQEITESYTAAQVQETTLIEKLVTTESIESNTEVDDEETSDEPVPSYIIKNDEDESDEDNDSEESDPITSVVEDVLGDEDDKKVIKKEGDSKIDNVKTNDKKESKDVVDDIIDGMVDTIAGDDDDDEDDSDEDSVNKNVQTTTNSNDDDDDDDDDDDILDDEDDDESEEDDDEDDDDNDDDDEARNKQSRKLRNRIGMRLIKLHS